MNICIVIPTLQRGGAERVAVALANDFVKRGDAVTIITFDNNPPGYQLNEAIKLESVYLGNISSILNVLKRVRLLKKKFINNQPDIILSFFMKTTIYSLLAYLNRAKIIGSERSNPFYQKKSLLYRLLEGLILPKANGFIFLTKEARLYYSKLIQAKSVIIPNGIFIDDLEDRIVKYNDRKLNEICAVGRLHSVKDYPTMLRAFHIFSKTHDNHILKIYGEGPEFNRLSKQVKELKLEDKVKFMGLVKNVSKFTADSGMYILTSRSESWCNALMESLALGIPSVATDCDFGPRTMIQNGVNGLLVPVGDEKSIADAMSKIADDPQLASMLSKNAQKIRQSHNSTRIFDMYYDYIKKVMNS